MSSDVWGYLVAAGVGTGLGWWGRRRNPGDQSDEVALREARDGEHGRLLRPLDVIAVECANLEHRERVPAVTFALDTLRRDLRIARGQGWAGDAHSNKCHYHNPHGGALDVIHVVCRNDDCNERAHIDVTQAGRGFSRIRSAGWRNAEGDKRPLCPFCARTRLRPRQ